MQSAGLARRGHNELMIFLEDVAPVGYLRNLQQLTHIAGHIDRHLMDHKMAKFVGKDSGQLVFVLCQRDNFGRDVNTTARRIESIRVRQVDEKELKMKL